MPNAGKQATNIMTEIMRLMAGTKKRNANLYEKVLSNAQKYFIFTTSLHIRTYCTYYRRGLSGMVDDKLIRCSTVSV